LENWYENLRTVLIIDAEFRLSKCLVQEYALLKDIARGQSEATEVSITDSGELGRGIAVGVHDRKRM